LILLKRALLGSDFLMERIILHITLIASIGALFWELLDILYIIWHWVELKDLDELSNRERFQRHMILYTS
jgi:hypothetical protein